MYNYSSNMFHYINKRNETSYICNSLIIVQKIYVTRLLVQNILAHKRKNRHRNTHKNERILVAEIIYM